MFKPRLLLLTTLLINTLAYAVPGLINYQGTYLDNAGVPVTQANTPVVISIWNDAQSTDPLNRKYAENHIVNVDDGVFSLKIGAGNTPVGTFNAQLFDTASTLYLQLTINGEVMLPRVRFLSAPYTLQSENAARLGNQPANYYASAISVSTLAASINAMEERLCKATWGSRWISSLPLCVGGAVDVSDIDLSGLDLAGVRLDGAVATKTQFDNADLSRAYIRNLLFAAGKPPFFPSSNLKDATLTHITSLDDVILSSINPTGLYSNELGSCPAALPENWYCIPAMSDNNTPPYRLVGPDARFADDPDLPPATWVNTVFPDKLNGVNFRSNVFRNCTFPNETVLTDANFLGARIIGCSYDNLVWDNTICPDGSISDNNDGTCVGHGF